MRTFLGRTFKHGCADALTRHLHQTEMRNSPHLDARAVVLERIFEPALDGAVVALLVHVDEVDDDQAREIAQS